MVPAGDPVDQMINNLIPHLDKVILSSMVETLTTKIPYVVMRN